MNKICIVGNLTKDPELRATEQGNAVCSFTVAVNRRYKDQDGNTPTDPRGATATFIPVVVWRDLAENCAKYLAKGHKVAVSGALQIRSYTDRDGVKRWVSEIQANEVDFLTPRGESSKDEAPARREQDARPASPKDDWVSEAETADPFPWE